MTHALFAHPITISGSALFLSDAHFGIPSEMESKQREEAFIQLLQQHQKSLQHLFLLGDIFDFWFEYKDVVPKGYFRIFNTLYELSKAGVNIYYFTGNHDMWVTNYFVQELGIKLFYQPKLLILNDKRYFIGHGDGLGGKQCRYLFIKHLFAFKPNRFLYSLLHPRCSFAIARYCSRKSRSSHQKRYDNFLKEQEFQVQYARKILQQERIDYFIFGHRHTPTAYPLTDTTIFFNTGDWLTNFSYILVKPQENTPTLYSFKQH